MTEVVTLICVRLADQPMPLVPSFRDRCGTCAEEVWRSNRSTEVAAGTIVCSRCAEIAMEEDRRKGEDTVVEVAPYVAADLLDMGGKKPD